jgi:hypothetical protein
VLALTDDALVMRLAATTFLDEDSGKRVTQQPEGDYFLVWRKEVAASAAVAAVEADSDAEACPPCLSAELLRLCLCTLSAVAILHILCLRKSHGHACVNYMQCPYVQVKLVPCITQTMPLCAANHVHACV